MATAAVIEQPIALIMSVSTPVKSSSSEQDAANKILLARTEKAAERASQSNLRATELADEAREREMPFSKSSASSTCNPHDRSRHTASAATGPEPRGTVKRARRKWSFLTVK